MQLMRENGGVAFVGGGMSGGEGEEGTGSRGGWRMVGEQGRGWRTGSGYWGEVYDVMMDD